MTVSITSLLSALIAIALLISWLALIVRKRSSLAHSSPFQSPRWFFDIFRQGLAIIRQNPLILIIPLAATVVQYSESLFFTLRYLKKNPEVSEYVFLVYAHITNPFFGSIPIPFLPPSIAFLFFDAVGKINVAALHGLDSLFFTTLFLLLVAYFFLKPRREDGNIPASEFTAKPSRRLGILAALTGGSLLSIQIASWTIGLGGAWRWITVAGGYSYPITWPFAYALLISAMDRGDKEQVPPSNASFSIKEHFGPLFFFTLAATTVSVLGVMSWWSLDRSIHTQVLRGATAIAINIIFAMISFVPIIIVVCRTSFLSAFSGCAELWARHPINAAVLVVLGGLLLLFPVSQEGFSRAIQPSTWTWEKSALQFLFSLFTVSAGVLIMCSMVVFCKRIQELEEIAEPEVEEK